jgi:hypothetical protein
MPHAWRFSAPLTAWRRRCARPDAPRVARRATEAFVDRTPIDWTALLRRAGAQDRAHVENLRILDTVRAASRAAGSVEWPGVVLLVRATIALSMLQIACGATLVAGDAIAGGGLPRDRVFVQSIVATSHVLSAALLALTVSRDPRRLFLLAAMLCTASAFVRAASRSVDPIVFAPAAVVVRGIWPEVLTPGCMWLFALTFPRVTRFTVFDRIARRLTTVAWIAGIAILVLSASVAYLDVDDAPFASLLPNHASNLFWRVFTLVDLLAIGAIFLRARRAPADERLKVWRVAKAIGLCVAPFLAMGIARTILPPVDAWLVSARRDQRLWLDAMIVTGLCAAPVLTAIAVAIDRPFDLQGIVRRSWTYAFARGAGRLGREQKQLARDIDAIRQASDALDRAQTLERAVRSNLRASVAYVLMPHESGAYAHPNTGIALSRDMALCSLVRASPDPIAFSTNPDLAFALPEADRQWLARYAIDLAAAITSADGRLAGVVIAGRRFPRRPFDRRDAWTLATLTSAAAASWTGKGDSDDRPASECSACGLVAATVQPACSCGAVIASSVLPLRIANRFVLHQRIGTGSTGVVYVARDERLGRDVALKTLTTVRQDAIARLREEARAMAALNHEGLATIYGLELWHITPVLVVEYFPAGTLAQILLDGPLPPSSVVRLGLALARALEYMHRQGVLHRDLKPSNIGITASGAPKLLDFGLSTFAGSAQTVRFGGTPAYLPPQAFGGARADARFDLWALGVVLAEAVTGMDPQHFADGLSDDLRLGCEGSHPALVRVLERALAKHEDERFHTCAEFLAALVTAEA